MYNRQNEKYIFYKRSGRQASPSFSSMRTARANVFRCRLDRLDMRLSSFAGHFGRTGGWWMDVWRFEGDAPTEF